MINAHMKYQIFKEGVSLFIDNRCATSIIAFSNHDSTHVWISLDKHFSKIYKYIYIFILL